tara:strand:- start:803 stop:1654 length:852 start_codon:yes stop_codon:yes gene_type:complete
MSTSKPSLFADLAGLTDEVIESMYEEVLGKLATVDAELVGLHLDKKIHSETIKFAVNKQDAPPTLGVDYDNDLIHLAIQQKEQFDALIKARDALVERLVVPPHRVSKTMHEFYNKLTADTGIGESPTLASEIEMFSRFFELQAMLRTYHENDTVQSELRKTRLELLETIKSVNRNDRKIIQNINQNRERGKILRNEAGRLRTYMKSNKRTPQRPMPPKPDVGERLFSGESITMEELASMLEHGGLIDEKPESPRGPSKKRKKRKSIRRSVPIRGEPKRHKKRE